MLLFFAALGVEILVHALDVEALLRGLGVIVHGLRVDVLHQGLGAEIFDLVGPLLEISCPLGLRHRLPPRDAAAAHRRLRPPTATASK